MSAADPADVLNAWPRPTRATQSTSATPQTSVVSSEWELFDPRLQSAGGSDAAGG